MLYYLLLVALGALNAFFSPYLYFFIGSLFFRGEGQLFLFVGPIAQCLSVLFFVVEIPTASLVTVWCIQRVKHAQRRFRASLSLALVLFVALQLGAQIIPPRLEQIRAEMGNPLQVGQRQLDFSKAILFNGRQSAKHGVKIEKRSVVWIEHTKESPPYPYNVWDVFLFEFSPETTKGLTTQITHLDKTKGRAPADVGISNGKVYWIQDGTLFRYDSSSQKGESLAKAVSHFYGAYSHNLIFDRGANPDFSGAKERIYAYDSRTKQEAVLTSLPVPNPNLAHTGILLRGPQLCYCSRDYRIGRFEIPSQNNEWALDLAMEQEFTNPRLLDCQGPYIAYTVSTSTDWNSIEMRVVQTDQQKVVFKKPVARGPIPTGKFGAQDVQGKLQGRFFYYSTVYEDKVMAVDLVSGEEKPVLSQSGLDEWDIDGDYIVYRKATGVEYQSELCLQKI